MTIQFTATIYQSRKGEGYIARADELGVRSALFKTMPGALKHLNEAVRAHLEGLAEKGNIAAELLDAGFSVSMLPPAEEQVAVTTHDCQQIVMTMPRKASNALRKSHHIAGKGH